MQWRVATGARQAQCEGGQRWQIEHQSLLSVKRALRAGWGRLLGRMPETGSAIRRRILAECLQC